MPPDVAGIALRAAVATLSAVSVVTLVLLVWRIADILLLVFASVLLALLLRGLADWIARRTGAPIAVGLGAAIGLILLAAIGSLWLFGAEIAGQFDHLTRMVPDAWARTRDLLEDHRWGLALVRLIEDFEPSDIAGGVLRNVRGATMALASFVAAMVLVVVGGVYLAVEPSLYRRGLLHLLPRRGRARAEAVLDHCGGALRQWLKGQVLAMAMIGTLSGLGLGLLGVPSAAALGLIAGLAEFVPFVGPIAGAVLALLVASALGPATMLWVLILFLAIQQIEGNLVTPLIERRLVSLPMALTLFSIVAMGVVFGPLGVLLATPLTVLLYALVAKLYVEGVLGRRVPPPGG